MLTTTNDGSGLLSFPPSSSRGYDSLSTSSSERQQQPRSFWEEYFKSFQLAWPLVATYLLQCLNSLVGMALVGHLGPAELGAASLGNMFCNLTGVVIGFGLATAAQQ